MDEPAPTRKNQLTALRRIDALSEKLQTEGKLLEALQCMEKSLILRGHCFGLDSMEVFRACKSVGEMCNYLAMTYLQKDEFDVALELLKKAEVLTERHKEVRAVTFNNMGCYFRKRGKLRTALNYVRKALRIEEQLGSGVKMADTHLNMCTIMSELKRHEKALVHARTALKLLLMELFGPDGYASKNKRRQEQEQEEQEQEEQELEAQAQAQEEQTATERESEATGGNGEGGNERAGEEEEAKTQEGTAGDENEGDAGEGDGGEGGEREVEDDRPQLPADRVAVLAIAYHNLAVQQEFLRKYRASLSSYEKACKVVTTHLSHSHPLVKSLTDSYNQAKEKLEARIARQEYILQRSNHRKEANSTSTGNTITYNARSTGELNRTKRGSRGGGGGVGYDGQPVLTAEELRILATFKGTDLSQEGYDDTELLQGTVAGEAGNYDNLPEQENEEGGMMTKEVRRPQKEEEGEEQAKQPAHEQHPAQPEPTPAEQPTQPPQPEPASQPAQPEPAAQPAHSPQPTQQIQPVAAGTTQPTQPAQPPPAAQPTQPEPAAHPAAAEPARAQSPQPAQPTQPVAAETAQRTQPAQSEPAAQPEAATQPAAPTVAPASAPAAEQPAAQPAQ